MLKLLHHTVLSSYRFEGVKSNTIAKKEAMMNDEKYEMKPYLISARREA